MIGKNQDFLNFEYECDEDTLKKVRNNYTQMKWVKLGPLNSEIGLTNRPKLFNLQILKNEFNVTCVITCEAKNDHVERIQQDCQQLQMKWINVELFPEGSASVEQVTQTMIDKLQIIKNILDNNKEKAIIHCMAGRHRTGFTAFSLLRYYGYDEEQTLTTVKLLRQVSYDGLFDQSCGNGVFYSNFRTKHLQSEVLDILNKNKN